MFFNQLPELFVSFMNNHFSVVFSTVIMIVVAYLCLLIMMRFFGKDGIYVFTGVGIIAANILVLKIVQYPFYKDPVAMATELFCIIYLGNDILNEYYGKTFAKRNVLIGFAAYIILTILMLIGLGFTPIDPNTVSDDLKFYAGIQDNIKAIFMPSVAILIASMTAYIVSQYNDIWVYALIKECFRGRHIWLRANASNFISGFVDNVIFSVLAWVVFSPNPVDIDSLIFTYILGTYWLRIMLSILSTPFIYWAKFMLPEQKKQRYIKKKALMKKGEVLK